MNSNIKNWSFQELLENSKELAFDLNYTRAKEWKKAGQNRILVGFFPIYIPREIVHAANGLAVGIFGGGDRKQIIKGDAYYQSYICHIPRSIIELVLDGHFADLDGFIFPSICDVIRNLSGMFLLLGKGTFVKYLDFPQNFSPSIGGTFYKNEMQLILDEMFKINKIKITPQRLNHSIELYNKNRQLIEQIYDIRQEFPWRLSMEDIYCIIRAGMVIPVEDHNEILEKVCNHIQDDINETMDKIKVVISGAFCEQPPIGLIKTIEMSGCYVIDDDLMLGSRWVQGDVEENTDDPINALAEAYLNKSAFSSSVYDVGNHKEKRLVHLVEKRKADGVLFVAPSFCDPALLDYPLMQKACEEANIRYITIQYSENTGQFKVIKEQVGAFSDSIKLWEEAGIV